MRIGLDLDNTIICYDRLFHRLATERDLIPRDLPVTKSAVRDHLRQTGRESEWTAMQGEAYGARIADAELFPGVINLLARCRAEGHQVHIISHKTERPFSGPDVDLHASALGFLEGRGVFDFAKTGLTQAHVWFEPTKQTKMKRIGSLACDVFVDDLPEFLLDSGFPQGVRRVLFDPSEAGKLDARYVTAQSWQAISHVILDVMVQA